VIVRGFDHSCWKRRKPNDLCHRCPCPEEQGKSDDWLWFEEKHALAFAYDLRLRTGKDHLAETIKEQFSKTAGDSYLRTDARTAMRSKANHAGSAKSSTTHWAHRLRNFQSWPPRRFGLSWVPCVLPEGSQLG
jgi:hypothetical protein